MKSEELYLYLLAPFLRRLSSIKGYSSEEIVRQFKERRRKALYENFRDSIEDEEQRKKFEELMKPYIDTPQFTERRIRHTLNKATDNPQKLEVVYYELEYFKDSKEASNYARKFDGRSLGKETFWKLELDRFEEKEWKKKQRKKKSVSKEKI